jgi:hypothetical protein
LKRLSKEENKRLKSRTEERIKIARAKENYWKKYRDRNDKRYEQGGEGGKINVEKGILMFEEDGAWINEERRMTKENVANALRQEEKSAGGLSGREPMIGYLMQRMGVGMT